MDPITVNIEITEKNAGNKSNHRGLKKRHENGIKFLLSNTKIDKNAKIIDLGCREGLFLEKLNNKGFTNLYGIDISKKAIDIINKTYPTFKCSVEDIHHISYDNDVFDVIICTHTLEHCDNLDVIINEMHRILKKKGLILVEVPIENVKEARIQVGHFSKFNTEEDLINLIKQKFTVLCHERDNNPKKFWFRLIAQK